MTSNAFDELDTPRDDAGKFSEKHHSLPEASLPALLSRAFAVTEEEDTFLSRARGAEKDSELRADAAIAMNALAGSAGASAFTIRAEREPYGITYWVHEQDGQEREDFDSFDIRAADIINAATDDPDQVAEIPGMARDGDGLQWSYSADAGSEFWVGTFDNAFEYGPFTSEGAAKSVIAARQPASDQRLYFTQSTS